MKAHFLPFYFTLFAFLPNITFAQDGDIIAMDDDICIQLGEDLVYNVMDNDILPPGFFSPVFLISPSNCFKLGPDGKLILLANDESCCGEHSLIYRYESCQGGDNCFANINIVVKCPKPECFVVDLNEFSGGSDDPTGQPTNAACVYACENSEATYFVTYDPTSTYSWTVTGGSYVAGANAAEIIVNWGPAGAGSISLTITNSNNETTTIEICVDILEGPIADFLASASCVCLNGPISFMNNSIGGNDFFWDFGDGNTSTAFEPTHQYSTPGTYTVTLYATRNNFDEIGNPLCCCTDTTSLEVIVEDLEGPNIYWVSTLCAKDTSKYWTDAMNCGTYNWTVLDETGTPISFIGQGNDTICVQWGNGPFGTVMLEVMDCDIAYCSKPTSVIIPIIPTTVVINGLTEVCENATETYTVPKWISVYYDWQLSGGTIISGQGTNTIIVHWGTAPGPGTISLNYSSDFLSGLPGQDPDDCMGNATLTVGIKPQFEVFGPVPGLVCTNSLSSFFATAVPSSGYTWSIVPSVSFTGQGTNFINVSWDGGAGIFVVTAMPNDPTAYCNDKVSVVIIVVELPPADGIDGPIEICPGETYTYFGLSSQTGVGFNWNVTGGTPTSFTGDPITVTWDPSGPYILSLSQYQLAAPFCISDPVQLVVMPKELNGPLTITGPAACTNSLQNYSVGPSQHPEATFEWTISPPSMGSVVSGQGTANVQVQWNNDPGLPNLMVVIELCDAGISTNLPVNLNAPGVPVITQIGDLCPGVSAILDAGAGFSSYAWSTSAISQTISISSGGTYIVTTTDANGCDAVATYQANELPGPVADISTPDFLTLCIVPPNSNTVTITAQTNPSYTYAWFCNGVPQVLPATQATLTHTNTNVVATFAYLVVVTDQNGCISTSNTITVIQTDNCSTTGGCVPRPHVFFFNANNQTPECNIVDFPVIHSLNVTLISWNFGDPGNNINTGTLASATHAYTKAGYFMATISATVPEFPPGMGTCTITETNSVCIPLAADFDFRDSCRKVIFTDLSTFLPGNDINSWSWNFGDFSTSSLQNPAHTYLLPGSYNVTLTVGNINGCTATIVKTVVVDPLPNPSMTINPNPACVNEPVSFSGSGTGIVNWHWDFGDGATNGDQSPSHTYLIPGSYPVTLTVVDEHACEGSVTQTVVVNPGPPFDVITFSPSLTICEGETVTLTAPAGTGYTYQWTTGATTQVITTGLPGDYGLTIEDANGCTMIPDPVTVVVIPKPDAFISGSLVICDNGCTSLTATGGFGYTYQWLDDTNTPIPFETFQTITVCDFNLLPAYSVIVTDPNACSSTSDPVVVTVETSPSFSINIAPDPCEGSPTILTVVAVQPNVTYAWSTGETGTSITVIQAGTYTCVGTDTLSGCTGTATATIHPLPDLCIVPVGCYEVCSPDTICGPPGLNIYQWNSNGAPIPGANDQCLAVTQSGTYSLTGTNEFGCTQTSGDLILNVISCDCEGLEVTATPLNDCCWSISYDNQFGDLLGLMISSGDTDFDFNLGSLDPSLGVQTIGSNWIGLVNSVSGNPLPAGQLNNIISFCLTNVQNNPQQVIFDWYDFEFNIVCSDTLEFECPVEPDCLYIASDTIYCENGEIIYEMTVCNPFDNAFSIGYIQLLPTSPVGIVVTPSVIDVTSNPILPGECRTFTFTLSGPNLANQEFCFDLSAHDFNPDEVDTALCCSLDLTNCITIPDCDPCDDVGLEALDPLGSANEEDCCFKITLFNNFDGDFFDGIGLCMITSNTTMTINNPFGSGWTTSSYSPTVIDLDITPPLGKFIPLGSFQLPEICIQTGHAPDQLLEIKWMQGDKVVCRDTVKLFCEPDCGYILVEEIICNDNGTWTYNGLIKNTSAFIMNEAHIVFNTPAGMGVYDQSMILVPLPPGGTTPFSLNLGAPAISGDIVCFTVALHELGHTNAHTNCCNFEHCIVLPDCIPLEVHEEEEYLIFPNPNNGKFQVVLSQENNTAVKFSLFSLNGSLITSWSAEDTDADDLFHVDISQQAKGLYILLAETDSKRWIRKVLIQ